MNKNILLILCLMFSLTLVSAETGYGCPQEINFTEVINNSGNIEVVYETRCVSSDDVSVGISVFNGVTGNGANCPKLNTTYEDNTYHITTACVYPTYNENLTFKVSITCPGCTPFPATLEINNTPVEEVNETEPEVVEPTPTPTPTKKKSSGGGSRSVKCGDWSVCTDGTQTQQCGSNVVKTRACESEVEIIQNGIGTYVDVGDIDKVDVPEPNTNEQTGFGEVVEEPKSKAWILWLIGIIIIILLVSVIVIANRD